MRIEVNPGRLAGKIMRKLLEGYKGTLVVLETGKLKTHYDPVTRTIYWRPRDGFFMLFHEAAHRAMDHAAGCTKDFGLRLVQESEAWLWAEEACYLWGFRFDYKKADRFFSTYASHVAGGRHWKIEWRHRDA